MLDTFYRVMRWLIEFELAIARSTGRNPINIRQLESELDDYRWKIILLEINK